MLGPDWHDAALPRAQSDLVVAELDHEIAAPDHDDLGAARVTVPTPLPPATRTMRTLTPPSSTASSRRCEPASCANTSPKSVGPFTKASPPERGVTRTPI